MTSLPLSRRQVLATGSAAVLGGCAGRSTAGSSEFDWPQFGRTATKTSSHSDAKLDISDGEAEWSSPIGGGIATSLVAAEGVVLFGTSEGISAYDSQRGDRQWHASLRGTPTGTPAVSGRTVVATATENPADRNPTRATISGFDVSDGGSLWQRELEEPEYVFSPTVTGDAALVRTASRLLTVDLGTGAIEWELTGLAPFDDAADANLMDLSPSINDDIVYVPNPDEIGAYSVERETVEWTREIPTIRSAPAASRDHLFVSSASSGVYALDASTGEVDWHWSATGCWTTPAVTQNTVYATANGMLVAIDRDDGTKRWEFDAHGDVYATPLVVGDVVVVDSIGWTAVGIDRGSGLLQSLGDHKWVFTGHGTRTTPTAADGRLYVPDGNQSLVAIAD